MTDNEIVKALEGMTYGGHSCMHCKYGTTKSDDRCGLQGCKIGRDALDLINRQQAEIERLKKERRLNLLTQLPIARKIKSEAIKEFWKKVRKHARIFSMFLSQAEENEFISYGDNLVKEMTEGCEK